MKIALITGGPSSEREVALSSGRSILKSLRELNHKVKVIDPIYGSEEISEERIFESVVSKNAPSLEKLREITGHSNLKILECINSSLFDDVDLAFLGLHGKFGEDGKIQTLLEMRGINYTGSDIFSSALAMDKDISKSVLEYNGIKTPKWISIKKDPGLNFESVNEIVKNEIGYPCVVKPNDEGSTVGLSIVQPDVEDVQLPGAIETAFNYSDKVLIEECILGKELTVSIIGNEALPVIHIVPKDGFYDYEHKYTKGLTEYICPADIPDNVTEDLKKISLRAHNLLGCKVYSRVDFILNDKNEIYCLEVNTLPGMTETSLVPKSAKAAGMSFTELIDRLIKLSLEKQNTGNEAKE
jgi:D-alanine-D-alanine ligase